MLTVTVSMESTLNTSGALEKRSKVEDWKGGSESDGGSSAVAAIQVPNAVESIQSAYVTNTNKGTSSSRQPFTFTTTMEPHSQKQKDAN